jgi:hypothetical protein
MRFACRVSQRADTSWWVRYDGGEVGSFEVSAGTRAEALEKARRELQYRLELCPCSGEQFRGVEVEVIGE